MKNNSKWPEEKRHNPNCRLQGLPGFSVLMRSVAFLGFFLLMPDMVHATQYHSGSEGIIVHQLGHLFFTLSMITLIFTINGKELNSQPGWKLIQYSAFMFILWNLDAIAAHVLDNQLKAVSVTVLPSSWEMLIRADDPGSILPMVYYLLKMDHLLCVPAIYLFYRGLISLVKQQTTANTAGDKQ